MILCVGSACVLRLHIYSCSTVTDFFVLMIRRPPVATPLYSSAASEVYQRQGYTVVLDNEKIRLATSDDAAANIIGAVSVNPSVIGDSDINQWKGKYLLDDFGAYIFEDYNVEDDDGNTVVQQRRKLNPDYDADQEYVSRENRQEWATIGMMGKLRIRKGQPTGDRWIKMRDISDTVEEWLVR